MKGQTRSQHPVKIAKNDYYKSCFKKLRSMNDLNKCEIPVVPPHNVFVRNYCITQT